MNIGLKLVTPANPGLGPDCLDMGGPAPLTVVRELGMQFVEYGIKTDWNPDALRQRVRHALDSGLRVHFHPYTDGEVIGFERPDKACRAIMTDMLEFCARAAREQGAPAAMVLHGGRVRLWQLAESEKRPRADYVAETRRYLSWLTKTVRDREFDVEIMLETNVPSPKPDLLLVGDSYDEALETAEGLEVGICWDMGHMFTGVVQNRLPRFPDARFLRRVRHVHLHEVVNHADHYPPIYGTLPIEQYVADLKRAGFDRDITLELDFDKLRAAGEVRDVLTRSVARVRTAWDAA
ncbi:MAG: sugar phosphate isomerase/epimerase [Kiritimatiellae bacterium]|nr:sugar phosphate isomerase/epimerase [Kiritimatiellia bacterium]